MAKISLYLDQRKSKGKISPLKIRISSGEETRFVSTGIKLYPADWDPSLSFVPARDEQTYKASLDIIRIKKEIDKALETLPRLWFDDPHCVDLIKTDLGKRMTRVNKDLVSEFENRSVIDKSRLFVNRLRAYRDKQKKAGTKEVYERTIRAVLGFDGEAEDKSFEQIDYAWLKRFEEHCLQTMRLNSLSIIMRNIRTVFNEALRDEITDAYPFRKYSIRQEETRKRSLTIEELRELASMPVEKWHEEYRDMFFLSFFLIGINMTDLLSLRPCDLHGDRIEYSRAKTSTPYSVKVEPEALSLINKYRGRDHLLAPLDRYATAKDYIGHMDKALKQIGRTTGKKGKILSQGKFPALSSYWARHSWASVAYNQAEASVDLIAHALGHKDRQHAVTMVYIDRDFRKVDDLNRKVIDILLAIQQD